MPYPVHVQAPVNLIPALVEAVSLRHYQQGVDVRGKVFVDGTTVAVDGQGMRDRTWGPGTSRSRSRSTSAWSARVARARAHHGKQMYRP